MSEGDEYLPVPLTEGEFVIPPSATGTTLVGDNIYNLLTQSAQRGYKIARLVVFMGLTAVAATIFIGAREWMILSAIVSLGAGLMLMTLRKNIHLGRKITDNPMSVTWAHPTLLCAGGDIKNFKVSFLTVHLNTGEKFEVGMAGSQIVMFFAWLRQKNSGVRLSGSLSDIHCNERA